MSEIRLPVGAEELLAYFEGVDSQYSDPHWRNGAEMCRRWIRMMADPPTKEEVKAFVARLESEKSPGSGWIDLRLQLPKLGSLSRLRTMMPPNQASRK
jgi:hypothetical protein